MNVGYKEAIKDEKNLNMTFNCFIFHDVDLIPEDRRIIYMCDDLPIHFAVSVSSLNYQYDGDYIQNFGGITSFTREQFKEINGFRLVLFENNSSLTNNEQT